ncbi:60S acidic ribosomal protein P1 [Tritrichomonas musculus]|uniref:60S acidic ribosomal protein P1 n=1 Tax=Tritrichomonas musculus TaxID=1915356 RepID=A0ABR2ILF9_9EUKA
MASPELSCVYAALVLNDDNVEISSDKIRTLLDAAGVKVDSFWVEMFAEYFKTHDVSELIKGTNLGGSSKAEQAIIENKESHDGDPKDEKNEEEEVEMGGFDDLFA